MPEFKPGEGSEVDAIEKAEAAEKVAKDKTEAEAKAKAETKPQPKK
jgi:hypothetical protein